MIAFTPQGPILSVAAAANVAAAAVVAVQVVSTGNTKVQQIKMSNTDSTNDAVVGWGQTAAQAAFNAVVANAATNCTFLMHSTIEVITVPDNCFVTAILAAGTPTIKLQAGYGN